MTAKLIAAGVALCLIMWLCTYAHGSTAADTETLRALANQAQGAIDQDDLPRARERLNELGLVLDSHRTRLEVLTSHSAINEIGSHLAQAYAFLLHDEKIQASSEIAALKESLTILYELQRLSWSNLF